MKTKTIVQKLGSLIFLALFLLPVAHAQEGSTPEQRAKTLTEKMKTELTLTDSQYDKVYEVNLKYAVKNQEILKGSGNKLSKFKSLKSTNEDKSDEMKNLLTEEQYKKYEELQKEQRQEAKKNFKAHKNGA